MAQPMIKTQPGSSGKLQHSLQNIPEILIYDLTSVNCHDIIKAATLVHTKRHRTIFHFISERELHLIAVSCLNRTGFQTFKHISLTDTIQQSLYLPFLQLYLFFIWQIAVSTASALTKMTTVRFYFQRRLFQNLQRSSLAFPLSYLIDTKTDFLRPGTPFFTII